MTLDDFKKDLEKQANMSIGDQVIAVRDINTVNEDLIPTTIAKKDEIGTIVNKAEQENAKFYLVEFEVGKRVVCINNLGMNMKLMEKENGS